MPADSDLSPFQRVQAMFGAGDGASYQTQRALIEHGEGMVAVPAPGAPVTAIPAPSTPEASIPAPAPIGGPSPSQELLDRVRAQGATRGQESLRRIMEQRQRQFPTPPASTPPSGGIYQGMQGPRG